MSHDMKLAQPFFASGSQADPDPARPSLSPDLLEEIVGKAFRSGRGLWPSLEQVAREAFNLGVAHQRSVEAPLNDLLARLRQQPHQAPCLRYYGPDRHPGAECICWQARAIEFIEAALVDQTGEKT